jgi:hypothetical protein
MDRPERGPALAVPAHPEVALEEPPRGGHVVDREVDVVELHGVAAMIAAGGGRLRRSRARRDQRRLSRMSRAPAAEND